MDKFCPINVGTNIEFKKQCENQNIKLFKRQEFISAFVSLYNQKHVPWYLYISKVGYGQLVAKECYSLAIKRFNFSLNVYTKKIKRK